VRHDRRGRLRPASTTRPWERGRRGTGTIGPFWAGPPPG